MIIFEYEGGKYKTCRLKGKWYLTQKYISSIYVRLKKWLPHFEKWYIFPNNCDGIIPTN